MLTGNGYRYLPGFAPGSYRDVPHHDSRDPRLPHFKELASHKLWRHGKVWYFETTRADEFAKKAYFKSRKIPADTDEDVLYDRGWLHLPECTAVICRNLDGSCKEEDDNVLAWYISPLRLAKMRPAEYAELETLKSKILGNAADLIGAKIGGTAFEREKGHNKATKQGDRCIGNGLSVQAMTDQVQPCSNLSRLNLEDVVPPNIDDIRNIDEESVSSDSSDELEQSDVIESDGDDLQSDDDVDELIESVHDMTAGLDESEPCKGKEFEALELRRLLNFVRPLTCVTKIPLTNYKSAFRSPVLSVLLPLKWGQRSGFSFRKTGRTYITRLLLDILQTWVTLRTAS